MGALVGPIFTAGAIKGQVIQARAGTDAALLAYEQTIISAFADVENALISWDKLQEQLIAEQRRVSAFKKYKYLATLKYNGGYSPYLEVLFAESQLYPAELTAAQTKAATFISLINIYKAMGGGWVIEADKMTCDPATILPVPDLARFDDLIDTNMLRYSLRVNRYSTYR